MAAFFADVLDGFLTPAFLEGVRKKFHYGDTLVVEFRTVAEEMLPLMRREAFWERKEASPQNQKQTKGVVYEEVVLSLGSGVDCLQESYSQKGLLSQSYMIEVLAGELLMQSYNAYNHYIRHNTDWHVARYHFPGSEEEFPLEILPRLLKELTPQITCNSAFCMSPKKSVAFIAELTKDEKVHCEGVCVGCNNIGCSNRVADVTDTL